MSLPFTDSRVITHQVNGGGLPGFEIQLPCVGEEEEAFRPQPLQTLNLDRDTLQVCSTITPYVVFAKLGEASHEKSVSHRENVVTFIGVLRNLCNFSMLINDLDVKVLDPGEWFQQCDDATCCIVVCSEPLVAEWNRLENELSLPEQEDFVLKQLARLESQFIRNCVSPEKPRVLVQLSPSSVNFTETEILRTVTNDVKIFRLYDPSDLHNFVHKLADMERTRLFEVGSPV